MRDDLFWDILDGKRQEILPLFADFQTDFYLAGGTALALQLGHRDSIDFDFFTDKPFLTNELYEKITRLFQGRQVVKTQEEKNTLSVLVDEKIKISFFAYQYKLIKPLIETEYFKIASIEDIALMKLSSITSRSVMKDYVDLYFILQKISLSELLGLVKEKFPSSDTNLMLKSLVYFDDIVDEPVMYKHNHEIDFESIKKFIENAVKDYLS